MNEPLDETRSDPPEEKRDAYALDDSLRGCSPVAPPADVLREPMATCPTVDAVDKAKGRGDERRRIRDLVPLELRPETQIPDPVEMVLLTEMLWGTKDGHSVAQSMVDGANPAHAHK